MNIMHVVLFCTVIFVLLFIVQIMINSRHPFSDTLKYILNGILALLAVNLSSGITGIFLPINLLSLGISAISGVPGVSMLIILNTLLS